MKNRHMGRGLALAVAGMVAGALVITPAAAHLNSPLTFKHLKKHFYTKAQSNARFINVGETATSADNLGKIYYRRSAAHTIAGGAFDFEEVACPSGTLAVGGGVSGELNGFDIHSSHPSNIGGPLVEAGFNAWAANVENHSGGPQEWRVYVICVQAGTVDANYPAGIDPAN